MINGVKANNAALIVPAMPEGKLPLAPKAIHKPVPTGAAIAIEVSSHPAACGESFVNNSASSSATKRRNRSALLSNRGDA